MIRLIIYGAIVAVVLGALGVYHHKVYQSGVDATQLEQLEAIAEACGKAAKTPKDCFAAGVESVRQEFAGKIAEANATIQSQSQALKAANGSIDRLRADSERRSKAATAAIAELEAKARDVGDRLAAVLVMQPQPGETPCEAACSLLRSFTF